MNLKKRYILYRWKIGQNIDRTKYSYGVKSNITKHSCLVNSLREWRSSGSSSLYRETVVNRLVKTWNADGSPSDMIRRIVDVRESRSSRLNRVLDIFEILNPTRSRSPFERRLRFVAATCAGVRSVKSMKRERGFRRARSSTATVATRRVNFIENNRKFTHFQSCPPCWHQWCIMGTRFRGSRSAISRG